MRGREAAALVDRDVDDHRARLHAGDHLARDELRRERAGDEHGSDHNVRVGDGFLDLQAGGHEQRGAGAEDLLEMTHAVDRALDDRHVRAQTERDDGGVVSDHPAADDDDLAGSDARHGAEEEAPAA